MNQRKNCNSAFNVGYSAYLTEFSTRQTIERNQALSWFARATLAVTNQRFLRAVSSLSVCGAGVVNFVVTTLNMNENGIVSKYREYSDAEIRLVFLTRNAYWRFFRFFYIAVAFLGAMGMTVFAFLPNREVIERD